DGAVENPQVLYGMPGSTSSTAALLDQGGGVFKATLTVTNPQELAYRIQWQDANGAQYTSGEVPFEAQGGHVGVTSALSETTVMDGSTVLHQVHVETTVPDALASNLLAVAATWEGIDGTVGSGSTGVEGVDSGLGYSTFELTLGASTPLAGGKYLITLRGVGETEDVVLDTIEVTLDD